MTEVPTTEWSKDFDEGLALDERAEISALQRERRSGGARPASSATSSRIFRSNSRVYAAELAGAHAGAAGYAVGQNLGARRRGFAKPDAQGRWRMRCLRM